MFILCHPTKNEPRKRIKGIPLKTPSARANDVSLFRLCRNGRFTHVCAKCCRFSFCVGDLIKNRQHGGGTQAMKQKFLLCATRLCSHEFQTKRDSKNPCPICSHFSIKMRTQSLNNKILLIQGENFAKQNSLERANRIFHERQSKCPL